MAEKWTIAFGRYLRTLRERRGLSLADVNSLSQPFADTVNKGYLSRCENGRHPLGFPKVIALSRIYEVPADVFVERMELDMELDQIGGPDTEGVGFAELRVAAGRAMLEGYRWDAYAYARDAVKYALTEPVCEGLRDPNDQLGMALRNCATAAKTLGKLRLALHEFLFLRDSELMSEAHQPLLMDRIAVCYMGLNQHRLAAEFSERAVAEGEKAADPDSLCYIYGNRAHLAAVSSEPRVAARYYQRAYQLFKQTKREGDCTVMLNNLAQCYFNMERYGAARRASESANNLARHLGQHRTLALSQILLGEIDELETRAASATARWKEAAEIAKSLRDKHLRFKADYLLFKQAVEHHNLPVARSIERRLRRLAPWMPEYTEEVVAFRRLLSTAENAQMTGS